MQGPNHCGKFKTPAWDESGRAALQGWLLWKMESQSKKMLTDFSKSSTDGKEEVSDINPASDNLGEVS